MPRKMIVILLTLLCLSITSSAFAVSKNVTVNGDHGKLAAIIQRPSETGSYPVVIICHGLTASKENPVITTLAQQLEDHGIASIRFDFNGHGDSEGRFQDMTIPNEIVDAQKIYDYLNQLPWVTSISIAGHSQGGVVASMTAGILGKDKIKCIALLAPASIIRENALMGVAFSAQFDPDNPPEYVEIGGPFRIGHDYVITAKELPIYEMASQYRGSACIIHGTSDRLVPYTCGERFAYIYPNSELHLLPGYDHNFTKNVVTATNIAVEYFARHLKD